MLVPTGVSTYMGRRSPCRVAFGKRDKENTFLFALADNRIAQNYYPKMANKNFRDARGAKKDEFYTQLADIEKELRYYKDYFRGKIVLCNCDDPRVSNFFRYFSYNFEHLGLKKLITTCYKNQNRDFFSKNDSEHAIWLEYFGDRNGNRVPDPEEIGIHHFKGDGDFRSQECIELLKEADVVVTNPPFSLFREYVTQLMAYEKKFLIIGNTGAATYEDIFPYIKEDKMWIGVTNYNVGMMFMLPDNYTRYHHIDDNGKKIGRVSTSCWWTNIENKRRAEEVVLYKTYNEADYPKFDTFDAININNYKDMPMDYYGIMGVPMTFLGHYNPKQFEIVGKLNHNRPQSYDYGKSIVNGKELYARLLIRRRQVKSPEIIPYQPFEAPILIAAEDLKTPEQS